MYFVRKAAGMVPIVFLSCVEVIFKLEAKQTVASRYSFKTLVPASSFVIQSVVQSASFILSISVTRVSSSSNANK